MKTLLEAAKAILKHPHITAYLPYDPNDPAFRALLEAVKAEEALSTPGTITLTARGRLAVAKMALNAIFDLANTPETGFATIRGIACLFVREMAFVAIGHRRISYPYAMPPHSRLAIDKPLGAHQLSGVDLIQRLPNAQFIVRACNSHYELLSAAKKALGFINDLADSNPGYLSKLCLQDYKQWHETLIELPAAVAKAEGR